MVGWQSRGWLGWEMCLAHWTLAHSRCSVNRSNKKYSNHIFFIHSTVDWQLTSSISWLLQITPQRTWGCIFFWISVFLWKKYPEMELLGHMVVCQLLRKLQGTLCFAAGEKLFYLQNSGQLGTCAKQSIRAGRAKRSPHVVWKGSKSTWTFDDRSGYHVSAPALLCPCLHLFLPLPWQIVTNCA